MGAENYIRAITAEISTANTDTLLYTVPSGNTFIAFEKKIETEGGGEFEWGVTPSIVAEGFPSNMGLDGTWQWDSGSNAYTMYSSAQGMTMYLNKRVVGTTPRYSIDYEAKTQGSYWLRNDDSENVLTSTWYTQTEDLVSGGFSMPSSGGSNESVEVVFKEEIVSGSKQVCAIIDSEEQVKERYEAGTSIYVNATASCTASIVGILFDSNMVPLEVDEESNSESSGSNPGGGSSSAWAGSDTLVAYNFLTVMHPGGSTNYNGTYTYNSSTDRYEKTGNGYTLAITQGTNQYIIINATLSDAQVFTSYGSNLFDVGWFDVYDSMNNASAYIVAGS